MRVPYVRVPIWVPLLLAALYFSGTRLFPSSLRVFGSKAAPRATATGAVNTASNSNGATATSSSHDQVSSDTLKRVVSCLDRTVCRARHPNSLQLTQEQRAALRAQRWFVAITLRNNAHVMNHFLHELLVALSVLAGHDFSAKCTETEQGTAGPAAASLPANAYVSIFESNSDDPTPAYLSMYDDVLGAAGVPHTVLSTLQLSRLRAAGRLDELLKRGPGRALRAQEEGSSGQGPGLASATDLVSESDGYEGLDEVAGSMAPWLDWAGGPPSNSTAAGQARRLALLRLRSHDAREEPSPSTGRRRRLDDFTDADRAIFHVGSGEKWSGNRVAFLARIRNWVMKPLYDNAKAWQEATAARDASASSTGDSAQSGTGDGSPQGEAGPGPAAARPQAPKPFTRVLFLNDVYYCAEDVIRLALHTVGRAAEPSAGDVGSGHEAVRQPAEGGSTTASAVSLDKDPWASKDAVADAACAMDFDSWAGGRTGFYDKWVARDIHGAELDKPPPFMRRESDQLLMRKGQPVPVFCCWNGAVAATSKPFYVGVPEDVEKNSPKGPVRFRRGRPGECAASECSLFCKDFWSAGARRFIIDPHVRLAYVQQTWDWLTTQEVNWLDADAQKLEVDGLPSPWPHPGEFPRHPPGRVFCCGLEGNGRSPDQGCIGEQLVLPGRKEELEAMKAMGKAQ